MSRGSKFSNASSLNAFIITHLLLQVCKNGVSRNFIETAKKYSRTYTTCIKKGTQRIRNKKTVKVIQIQIYKIYDPSIYRSLK